MFNLKYLPYIFIAVVIAYGYYTYVSMKDTINSQKFTIDNQKTVIQTQIENEIVIEQIHADTVKKEVFKEVSKEKKTTIEKEIKYDKNNSVDINSTRFYL
jgi:hypothetical protein